MANQNIDIEVAFSVPPSETVATATQTMGTIQIKIGNYSLLQYENQEGINERPNKKWYNYYGKSIEEIYMENYEHYVSLIIYELLSACWSMKSQKGERFSEKFVDISQEAGDRILVFSFLDGVHIRIAFQNEHGRDDHFNPKIESALGLAVELDAFCREAINASDAFLHYTEQCGTENTPMAENIRTKREELQVLLDE